MMEFDPHLLHGWLERAACRTPDKFALVCDDARWTYGRLHEVSLQVARALAGSGIQRHDRVVVFMDNSVETVQSIYGIMAAGAAFVVLNGSVKAAKLRYIMDNCGARLLLANTSRSSVVAKAFEDGAADRRFVWTGNRDDIPLPLRSASTWWPEWLAMPAASRQLPRIIDVDLAALIYTSGSTGEPKGVMSTHRNMVSAARSIVQYVGNSADDVVINVLPLSFDYGLYQLLMTVMFGGTLVLEKSFSFLHPILQLISRERVTGFPVVPTLVAMLLGVGDLTQYSLESLRYLTNTGAALPGPHIQKLRELFPSVKLFSMFGLTECKRVCYMPPEALDSRPNSVGKAMPNCETFVLDQQGRQVPPGTSGELVIRGGNVMQGYWSDPETTRRTYRDGCYHDDRRLYSGDLFRTDEAGYLYFLGRRDNMIKSKGERISPKEVENAVCSLPGVAEAAAVGVPDPLLGQAVKVFVVPVRGSTVAGQDILRGCARLLESFMVPKYVEVVDQLPKTAHGKVDMKQLNGQTKAEAQPQVVPHDLLDIDCERETERIVTALRRQLRRHLKRRGFVVAVSGGIDSSVTAALCAKAVGPERILALLLPERESSPETRRLSLRIAEHLGLPMAEEDLTPILDAVGCYRRRNEAVQSVIPEYGPGYRCKLVLPQSGIGDGFRIFSVVTVSPDGIERRAQLTSEAYLGIVAATNFKQRMRKMFEYYHADRLNYAVAGTPNRQEYDQGFFVKQGDGSADTKPIAHLYKTQVYSLAAYLGLPREILERPPTTDTYSMPQTQEEFYFSVPYSTMDWCLFGKNGGIPPDSVAGATGLSPEQVRRVYSEIETKRRTTRYLHLPPLLVQEIPEVARPETSPVDESGKEE